MRKITPQVEKLIFNNLIDNYNLKDFEIKANYFDGYINDIFRTIIEINKKTGIVTKNSIQILNEIENEKITKEIIDLSFEYDKNIDNDWLNKITDDWRQEMLFRIQVKRNFEILSEGSKLDIKLAAKKLGITNDSDIIDEINVLEKTPTFNDYIYNNLPIFFKEMLDRFPNNRNKDLMLLSALSVSSVLFPNFWFYNTKEITLANFNLFVGAPASNDKSMVKYAYKLLSSYIENEKKLNEIERINFNNTPKDERTTDEPNEKYIVLPANNTYASVIKRLEKNGGIGLIYTTELSQLGANKNSDWGNFDNIIRQSFHNEPVMNERSGTGRIYIEKPYLSLCTTGTMDQIIDFLGDKTANGLFSRGTYYVYKTDATNWDSDNERFNRIKNIDTLEIFFNKKSQYLLDVYNFYKDSNIEIDVNKEQWEIFNSVFKEININNNIKFNDDDDIISINRRSASIAKRILMLLTIFRHYDSVKDDMDCFGCVSKENKGFILNFFDEIEENKIYVHSKDLMITLEMMKILVEHTTFLFHNIKNNVEHNKKPILTEVKPIDTIYKKMSIEFNSNDFKNICKEELDLSDKTIERYLNACIKNGVLIKVKRGIYKKIN